MNRIRHIRRLTAALAGLACAWLGIALAAPAAFAATGRIQPPGGESGMAVLPAPLAGHIHQLAPDTSGPVPVHTVVVTAGMPGWQIALIAIGAALVAATAAVLLDRARATRRQLATADA
jgi:hypothetical protein